MTIQLIDRSHDTSLQGRICTENYSDTAKLSCMSPFGSARLLLIKPLAVRSTGQERQGRSGLVMVQDIASFSPAMKRFRLMLRRVEHQ